MIKYKTVIIKTFNQVKNDNFDQVKFDQVIVCLFRHWLETSTFQFLPFRLKKISISLSSILVNVFILSVSFFPSGLVLKIEDGRIEEGTNCVEKYFSVGVEGVEFICLGLVAVAMSIRFLTMNPIQSSPYWKLVF